MITILLVAITAYISYKASRERSLYHKFIFNAYQIVHRREWKRLFTHALLHGSWEHLIINMLVLFSFGSGLERILSQLYGHAGSVFYVLLYVSAVVVSSLYSLVKHKNDPYYNAVGASGAVAAVVFANIFFKPMSSVYFFGLLPIPGILFAFLYLAYSYYMGKRGGDNIGHDAHFYGAVYGFIFPIFLGFDNLQRFIDSLL